MPTGQPTTAPTISPTDMLAHSPSRAPVAEPTPLFFGGAFLGAGVLLTPLPLLVLTPVMEPVPSDVFTPSLLSDTSLGDSAPSLGHSASILALERPACFRASERYLFPLVYYLLDQVLRGSNVFLITGP
jgi:hypothetical protein